jgi:carbonic anhydrase
LFSAQHSIGFPGAAAWRSGPDFSVEAMFGLLQNGAVPVDRILRGLSRFQKRVYPKHRVFFQKLALQQRPTALFITCADSRIDPCLLTQTKPGELFICRVIGNVVPRYPQSIGGVSATIEYAVGVLGVPDVIVCGHTDCGVMKGILNPAALKALRNVSAWLRHAQPARRAVAKLRGKMGESEFLLALTERNVIEQLANLRTHPAVAERLKQGTLNLHGWVYHIAEGRVTAYDGDEKRFLAARATERPSAAAANTQA